MINVGSDQGTLNLFSFIIGTIFCVLFIYCLILFIKFGHKAIKALDIYIHEKETQKHRD